jgi:hypothetical protein
MNGGKDASPGRKFVDQMDLASECLGMGVF